MSAYVIAQVKITDPVRYAEYVKQTPATIVPFGGRFIVRGGRAEKLEGTLEPNRVVILEFDSVERAQAWYASEAYQAPKALRQSASLSNLILVEGVS